MAKTVANLPADLGDLEPGDELLSVDELKMLSLLKSVKKAPAFERFPGTTVLRRCRRGQVMCIQGQEGASAFFILTTDDVRTLRERQLGTLRQGLSEDDEQQLRQRTGQDPAQRVGFLQAELEMLNAEPREVSRGKSALDIARRRVATAKIARRASGRQERHGWLHSLVAGLRGEKHAERDRPVFIRNDGPEEIDPTTDTAALYEGDIFGEMACFNRTPRSATVVVEQDCYMLEMLRNVLDSLNLDPDHRQRMDDIYRRRVLDTHLSQLAIFRVLHDEAGSAQLARLKETAQLEMVEPGGVFIDQHAPSDDVFIVRNGLAQVLVNAGCLFAEQEFSAVPWNALVGDLREASTRSDKLAQAVCGAFSGEILSADLSDKAMSEALLADVRQQLNRFIQTGALHRSFKSKEQLLSACGSPELEAAIAEHSDQPSEWSDLESRVFHRLLVEQVLCNSAPKRAKQNNVQRIIAYVGRGEILGEIGVLLDQPRSATCLAATHPAAGQKKAKGQFGGVTSRLELVRIDGAILKETLEQAPAAKERLRKLIDQRLAVIREAEAPPANNPTNALAKTPQFQNLGFHQGEKLMVIDLDRCTRCGVCVQACVESHRDGHTRLYLDGPRFGNFLAPLACRKCVDPVCMIDCPVGSIQKGPGGEIIIRDWCIGCSNCAKMCPYGSIQMTETEPRGAEDWQRFILEPNVEVRPITKEAVVCDLCASLKQGPACVYACPHEAALRVNAVSFFGGAADASVAWPSEDAS